MKPCENDHDEDEATFANLFRYLKIMLIGEVEIL